MSLNINDFKHKCYELCRNYLADIWLTVGIDDIEVRRLTGGFTNQLYYCAINDIHRTSDASAPQEVVIKLYLTKQFKENERTNDTIIGLLVSELGLGPKLYGVFTDGQIQQYYQHKRFTKDQQSDEKLVKELAEKLARIHAMDVPISKTNNWLFKYFDDNYRAANKSFDIPVLIDESNCETLKTYDLYEELCWLKDQIRSIDSPINFTHVDFRGGNIMVTENDGIVLCDFEYSCYGYRGYDFGTIFLEWGQEYWANRKDGQTSEYSYDQRILSFLELYNSESTKLLGDKFAKDQRNDVKRMVKEVKLFSLVGLMFLLLYFYKREQMAFAERS
ncbi:choline/ethanolamine kinase-like, partial [Oppia nitens]|uniref:choline/ethanolamine kinase-like n=1 Tax=Oppia nitens TaxID=1686743 RepID=UPI0023DB436B